MYSTDFETCALLIAMPSDSNHFLLYNGVRYSQCQVVTIRLFFIVNHCINRSPYCASRHNRRNVKRETSDYMEPRLKMSTLTILLLNLLILFVAGQSIHDIAGNSVCDLHAFVRVGDILRWRNPTNKTIYIKGEQCHTKLSIVIPPKRKWFIFVLQYMITKLTT